MMLSGKWSGFVVSHGRSAYCGLVATTHQRTGWERQREGFGLRRRLRSGCGPARDRPVRQLLWRGVRAGPRVAYSARRRHERHVDSAEAVSRPVLRRAARDADPLPGRFAAPGHRPRTPREGQLATPPACSCSVSDNSLLRLFNPVADRLQERVVRMAIKAQLAGHHRPVASARRPSVGRWSGHLKLVPGALDTPAPIQNLRALVAR